MSPNLSRYDNILDIAKELPIDLLNAMKIEKDISCRHVGRCTYGSPIDVELNDMIPRDANGAMIPLKENLGRHFLYARYDVDLSEEGLTGLGLKGIDYRDIAKMDAVEHIDDFKRIGEAAGREVDIHKHFGQFAVTENFWTS